MRSSVTVATSFITKRQRSEASSQEITKQVISESQRLRQRATSMASYSSTLNDRDHQKTHLMGKDVQIKLRNRIHLSERLVASLAGRLSAIEPPMYLLEQCIQEIDRTHKNYWPDLSVAVQRQKIREECPTGELDKDYLQEAIKWEQK